MKNTTDAAYLETFLAPLRVCATYLPAFGTSGGAGLSLADFKSLGGDRHHKSQEAIFEIRQGYKSADSKRQNADLRFGARAYQAAHIPVVAILSSQVSETVISRYRDAGMLIMTGIPSRDPTESTFAFFDQIIGYDLAGFFRRSSAAIKQEIHGLIEKLLSTE